MTILTAEVGQVASAHLRPATRPLVVLATPDSAECVRPIAAMLHGQLRLAAADEMNREAAASLYAGCELLVVAKASAINDDLLGTITAAVDGALCSDMPWRDVPRWSMLTAADLPSLERLAVRVRERHERGADVEGPIRRLSFSGDAAIVEALMAGDDFDVRRIAMTAELRPLLESRSAMTSIATHGVESCARGVDGLVFCGLRRSSAGAPGPRLACGDGEPCSRGPHPLPLRDVAADVLLVGSCGSLRLAGSALSHQFNLALSFVEGPNACGYIGSLSPNGGNELAAIVGPAMFAAGCDLAEVTAALNLLVRAGGRDRAVYGSIGLITTAVAPPQPPATVVEERADRVVIDATGRTYAEVVLTHPDVVHTAHNGHLVFSATGDRGVLAFTRVERSKDAFAVRAFLFSFPQPLGRVELRVVDLDEINRRGLAALRGLEQWIELAQLVDAADAEELDGIRPSVVESFTRSRADAAVNTAACASLVRCVETAEHACDVLRECVVDVIATRLGGAFWLPNAVGPRYLLREVVPETCETCGGAATRKRFRHMLRDEEREATICARCCVTSDISIGGELVHLAFDTPAEGIAGETLEFQIETNALSVEAGSLLVVARLSTPGLGALVPEPARVELTTGGGTRMKIPMRLALPLSLFPHFYFIKAIVASRYDYAFVSRKLGVRSSRPTTS